MKHNDECPICQAELDDDGYCPECQVWTIEPLSDEDIALLDVDLAALPAYAWEIRKKG